MDRDIALQINTKLNAVKTALQSIATNTTPTAANNRSISPDPEEQQRIAPAEEPEEPEAPEEEPESVPETTTRKRTTSK